MSITSHNAYDCRNNKENAPPSHNKRMVGFALNGDENDDDDNAGGVVHRRTPHPAKKQKELALSSDFKSKHSSKSIFSPEVLNTGTDMTAEMYNHDDELFKAPTGFGAKKGGDEQEKQQDDIHSNNNASKNNDDAEDVQGDEEENQDDQLWANFLLSKKEHFEGVEGLTTFLNSQNRWKAANDKLERALNTYTTGMNDNLQLVVHDLVSQIQSKFHRSVVEVSDKCKTHLLDSHTRREKCLQSLTEADRKSKLAFQTLIVKTMDEHPSMDMEASNAMGDLTRQDKDNTGNPKSNQSDEEEEAKLWNDILHDSNIKRAKTANRYLDGQQRLEDSHARFTQTRQIAQTEWKQKIQGVVNLVVDIHEEMESQVVGTETYIRSHMVTNDRREKEFEEKIRLANETRQAFFSGLMTKVAAKAKTMVFGKSSKGCDGDKN